MSKSVGILHGLLLGCVACAAQLPQFEVATVKPSPPPTGDLININLGRVANGTITFGNASLSDCLKYAYGMVSDEQLRVPDWVKSKAVRFDVVAKAPAGTPADRIPAMLQALLTERFMIVSHFEEKQLSYTALTIGKSGPKLKASTSIGGGPASRGRIESTRMTMTALARLLSRFERQTVVDQTGLTGEYELKLEWSPDTDLAGGGEPGPGPSLVTALAEQLGLRLESRKGPLPVLVLDSVRQTPGEN